jgi:transcriptional regulator with GAF, ATPase, and Fis domain
MRLPAQRKDVELLFKTIRDLVPQTDLETLLQHVIKVSTQILGADRTMLFLFDRKSEALVFKYGVNIEEGLIEVAHQFSSSVIERAKKGEFIMAANSQDRKKFSPSNSIYKFDIKTILCAPILTDDRLIGVIYADTKGKKARLDDEKKSYFLTFVELIADLIGRTIDLNDKEGELAYLKKRLVKETLFPEIVGRSPSIKSVKEKILRITAVNYPVSVLILGESGTGKELIARAIHQAGSRSGKPFVVVNCAAIPANLMESELFGHEKGHSRGPFLENWAFSRMPTAVSFSSMRSVISRWSYNQNY